jgi:hypothetical protein
VVRAILSEVEHPPLDGKVLAVDPYTGEPDEVGVGVTTRKRSIGTSTLAPVKNEPALTCLNSVRRAR